MAGKGSAPGERRGGRQKGTPNKLNSDLRAMILGALNDAGGRSYLVQQAHNNPGPFMALLGKTLPKDINATIKHSVEQMSDDELRAIILRGRGGMAAEGPSAPESSKLH